MLKRREFRESHFLRNGQTHLVAAVFDEPRQNRLCGVLKTGESVLDLWVSDASFLGRIIKGHPHRLLAALV